MKKHLPVQCFSNVKAPTWKISIHKLFRPVFNMCAAHCALHPRPSLHGATAEPNILPTGKPPLYQNYFPLDIE